MFPRGTRIYRSNPPGRRRDPAPPTPPAFSWVESFPYPDGDLAGQGDWQTIDIDPSCIVAAGDAANYSDGSDGAFAGNLQAAQLAAWDPAQGYEIEVVVRCHVAGPPLIVVSDVHFFVESTPTPSGGLWAFICDFDNAEVRVAGFAQEAYPVPTLGDGNPHVVRCAVSAARVITTTIDGVPQPATVTAPAAVPGQTALQMYLQALTNGPPLAAGRVGVPSVQITGFQ